MVDRLEMSPLPATLEGLVVMLHGGAEVSRRPVDGYSLALRRTRTMAGYISPALSAAGIGVGVLTFTVRGWNADDGPVPSPVADARRALTQVAAEFPDVPIVLVGHSMGARAASRVTDQPGVVGMVGLAPWLLDSDPVTALAGKHLVVAHGSKDRITSPKASRRFVERAAPGAASARFIDVAGRGHYMLAGAADWNRIAITEARGVLDRVSPAR
jgi:pimeloyl-ACP methyl ester carboxylesterase